MSYKHSLKYIDNWITEENQISANATNELCMSRFYFCIGKGQVLTMLTILKKRE